MVFAAGVTQAANATAAAAPRHAKPRSAVSAPSQIHRQHGTPAARRIAGPSVVQCSSTVVLGSTSTCVFAGAASARYFFTTAGPDTIRFRAVAPGSPFGLDSVLSAADGTTLCTAYTTAQNECAVPAAGRYHLDVLAAQAATVYTTIDSASASTSCTNPLDLVVNHAGTAVTIDEPGASWCATLPAAVAGDVLQFTLDSNSDAGLDIAVYDETGARRCGVFTTAFSRNECTLGPGTSFRLFATFDVDTAASTRLVAYRLSRPAGCLAGSPDAYGAAPSRSGTVLAHRTRCYTVHEAAAGVAFVHALGTPPSAHLLWTVRDSAGTVLCSGNGTGQVIRCPFTGPGTYALFVFADVRTSMSYLVSLTDLGSGGCTAGPATAFGADPADGTLATGAVDCRTFATPGKHLVRLTLWDTDRASVGTLLDANGAAACSNLGGQADCHTSGAGPYRVIIAGTVSDALDYHLWVTDLEDPAGCSQSSFDTFGAAPTHIGDITATNIALCWQVSVPEASAYFLHSQVDGGALFPRVELRAPGQPPRCSVTPGSVPPCKVTSPGTYLLVVTQSWGGYDPTQTGHVVLGAWRIDKPRGCVAMSTAFTAPATTSALGAVGQANCTTLSAASAGTLIVRSQADAGWPLTHALIAANGNAQCRLVRSFTCTTRDPGPYRVVSYSEDGDTGSYALRVGAVSTHVGCGQLAGRSFGTAPARAFSVPDPTAMSCSLLTGAPDAGYLAVRISSLTGPAPTFGLFTTAGKSVCGGAAEYTSCTLTGQAPSVLVLYGDAPVSGTVGWYNLFSTTGCAAPGSTDFGAPPATASIAHAGEIDCRTVSTVSNRFRFAFGAGTDGTTFDAIVLDTTGRARCELNIPQGSYRDCTLFTGAPYRVLIYAVERAGNATGAYHLHVWQMVQPTGCVDAGSISTGVGPLTGVLNDVGDEDCYEFVGTAGDGLDLTLTNDDEMSAAPFVEIMTRGGGHVCYVLGPGTGHCVLPANGRYDLIVSNPRAPQPLVGHYRVTVTRT